MSILISGNIHGNQSIGHIQLESVATRFPDWRSIRYLIVAGDWGAIWSGTPASVAMEKALLADYDAMPWETLVVLGNHEGYNRIFQLPWTNRHGGRMQQASIYPEVGFPRFGRQF